MDPVTPEESNAPSHQETAVSASRRPGSDARLDTWLTFATWIALVLVIAFAAFFAYSVYAQEQQERLSSPALQAVDALMKQVREKPDNAELRSRLAEALAAAGDLDRAKSELLVAIKIDPDYIGAYQNLATVEFELALYKESAEHWQKVLDLTSDSAMQEVNQRRELAFFNLGQIAYLQTDYVGAVGFFNAALRIKKDASDTYLLLAKSYLGLEQHQQALDKVNAALAFDPTYPEAHYVRGQIYRATGDLVAAAWDFRAALDGAPDNPEAQAAVESLGSYESWYGKAASAWGSRDASAALDAIRIARSIVPESYEAAMLHGEILERDDDVAGALEAYTIALKSRPDDPAATSAVKRTTAKTKE